ncbi:MAG: Gfo/Idh/MocA family oxidoreductase [Sporichthyaceae bacterium]
MTSQDPLRFGLVGTGYWARETHAAGIADAERASLVAVWGRDASAAGELAARHDAVACSDYDELLTHVDAVSFAVPPHVQAPLAVRAAEAGKHLLLEKPIALDGTDGDRLVAAVAESGVAALVFFTHLFSPPVLEWFDDVTDGSWLGGGALWLGSALTDDNPFNTPWRHEYGGLWDVGPHALVDLMRTLGPVVRLVAEPGGTHTTHLVIHHESGATSTATLTLSAPDPADGFTFMLWGPRGRAHLPVDDVDSRAALTVAVQELVRLVAVGERAHPSDLATGRTVLRLLTDAQHQIDIKESS